MRRMNVTTLTFGEEDVLCVIVMSRVFFLCHPIPCKNNNNNNIGLNFIIKINHIHNLLEEHSCLFFLCVLGLLILGSSYSQFYNLCLFCLMFYELRFTFKILPSFQVVKILMTIMSCYVVVYAPHMFTMLGNRFLYTITPFSSSSSLVVVLASKWVGS